MLARQELTGVGPGLRVAVAVRDKEMPFDKVLQLLGAFGSHAQCPERSGGAELRLGPTALGPGRNPFPSAPP